jgi:hypothetical protein
MIHNADICEKYNEPVLPDEDGNCSLCGAGLVVKPKSFKVIYRHENDELRVSASTKEEAREMAEEVLCCDTEIISIEEV